MAPEGFGSTFKRPAGSASGTPSPSKKQKLSYKTQQRRATEVHASQTQESPKTGK